MKEVRGEFADGCATLHLNGRIDSNNAMQTEQEIRTLLEGKGPVPVILDAEKLEYISSAGLRVILHLKKTNPDLKVINAGSDVYEILDMTGFTQMMTVEKAYRIVSVEGCEEIGRGANGTIYRIDQDNVVKVYNDADALEEIRHEREVARLALVLGVPTAISYDVVRVGDSYGSVFELLNAKSFSNILAAEPEKMDWCVEEFVEMLEKIHGTLVPAGELPDLRETVISWAEFVQPYLPEAEGKKLVELMKAIPHDDHMIHGDYHTKNVVLQGDEVLLIDMDTLGVGHPVIELASMFNAFGGYSELDHNVILEFQGFSYETARAFWYKVLAAYLGTENKKTILEVEDKARIIGYTRMIRRALRRDLQKTEQGKKELDFRLNKLTELLRKTDTLLFSRNELVTEAVVENLPLVTEFVENHLREIDCPAKARMQISIAIEEIFVNIANYAYAPDKGPVTVRTEITEQPIMVTITFIDKGVPYDPLAKEEPDITLSAEERKIGGLGIFMTKKVMDELAYEYKDGQNILKLKKNLPRD